MTIQPAHRVVQREVVDWANNLILNGKPISSIDISKLIAALTAAVEADRLAYRSQPESTSLISVWESLPLETKKAIRDESWDLVECIMKLVSRDGE